MNRLVPEAGCAILLATLILLRRRHIRVEYSFSWLLVGLVLAGSFLFEDILKRLTKYLGISDDTLWLGLAGALLTAILFEVSAAVSRLRDENVVLAQRLAILENGLQRPGESDVRQADQPGR